MEKCIRSFLKAVSWRIVATLTTMFLVFAFARSITIAGGVSIGELTLKNIAYHVHERLWKMVNFGR